jgi:large subunit ribosomal protein L21
VLLRAVVASSVRPLSTNGSVATAAVEQRPRSRFAVVDHSHAYEEAMRGMHGKQLQLAALDGMGKDDAAFDPFLEEELEEYQQSARNSREEYDEEDDDDDSNRDDEQDDDEEWIYNADGSLPWKKSQLVTFRAGAPAGGMFAIIELLGTQHKVTVDDLVISAILQPVEQYKVGSIHTLKNVMLVGSSHLTLVGMPYVEGAEVDVQVEEITQDAKVIVFKKKRRKGYKRKKGHRRDVTFLRILDVRPPTDFANHVHVQREKPELVNTAVPRRALLPVQNKNAARNNQTDLRDREARRKSR